MIEAAPPPPEPGDVDAAFVADLALCEVTLGAMTGCVILQPNDYDAAKRIHDGWAAFLAGYASRTSGQP